MTKVVIDAQTWASLSGRNELIELCDSSGKPLALYQPVGRFAILEGDRMRSPYSDEEIEQRRQQKGGHTLAEFWKEH